MKSVAFIHPTSDAVPLARFTRHDRESVRLIMRGDSVVDWVNLHLDAREDVDAFIRVNGFDPDAPNDKARLLEIKNKAVAYLSQHLKYRVPEAIRDADDVRQLFAFASQDSGRRANRFFACMTLKVMHIVNHSDGHELLSTLSVSHAELSILLHAKIERVVRGLLERNFPIVEFTGSLKSPYSILSKLLAKKDAQSAQVFDKLRFRFVTERIEDVPVVVLALTRELVPFNYGIPGQAHNSLVELRRLLVRAGNVHAIRDASDKDEKKQGDENADLTEGRRNEFSGPEYRVVHFVADIPLRIDRMLTTATPLTRELGPVVFGTAEMQVLDRVTAEQNELGENRHALYKARQRTMVKTRLERGRSTHDAIEPEAERERMPSRSRSEA